MKKLFSFVLVIGFLLLLNACYYDKADLLYPNSGSTTCDTSAIASYSLKVVPILQVACYSCHTVSSPSGGIAMATYATDKAIALNGKLYGSINHASGFSPMPKGASKLTACQILTVKRWIDAGSLNN